jgi:hypothetical protein
VITAGLGYEVIQIWPLNKLVLYVYPWDWRKFTTFFRFSLSLCMWINLQIVGNMSKPFRNWSNSNDNSRLSAIFKRWRLEGQSHIACNFARNLSVAFCMNMWKLRP